MQQPDLKYFLRKNISSLYVKKLNKALESSDSETKKLLRIKKSLRRYFTSPKQQKILKIALIASVTVGIGVAIYYHLPSQNLIIAFSSKCRKFFTFSDENVNGKTELEISNKPNSNLGKWPILGLRITIIAVATKLPLILHKKEVEMEVVPMPIKIILVLKDYRQIIGGVLVFLSVPVAIAGLPGVGCGLQFVGWQLATQGVS